MTTAQPHNAATLPEGVQLPSDPDKLRSLIGEVVGEKIASAQQSNPYFGLSVNVVPQKDPDNAARQRRAGINKWFRCMFLPGEMERQIRGGLNFDELCRDLGTGVNADGGYLVPTLTASEVLIKEENLSDFERYCRIWPMGSKNIQVSQVSTKPTATWRNQSGGNGEGGAITKSNPTFGLISLTSHPLDLYSAVSRELMQDSNVDIAEIMTSLLIEARQLAAQAAWAVGDADGKPTGLVSCSIPTVATLSAAVGYNDLRKLFYSVMRTYRGRAVWMMNNGGISACSSILSSTGQPIFKDPTSSAPPMIFGRPIVELPDIAGTGVDSSHGTTIYFGDPKTFYAVGVRTQLEVESNTQSDTAFIHHQVLIKATGRMDGKPALVHTDVVNQLKNVYGA